MLTGRRARAFAAHRHTELRSDLAPAQFDGMLDDDFSDFRKTVTYLHYRDAAGEIGDGDPKYRRSLEVAKGFDLALGILVAQLLEPGAHLALQARATGQLRQRRSSMSSSRRSG